MLSGWRLFKKTPVKMASLIMPDYHFLGIQQIQNRMFKLDGEKCSQMSTLGASPCLSPTTVPLSRDTAAGKQ